MGIDVTACPGCGKELVTGRDTGDKTVHLGKEWHKACFETAFPAQGPKKGLGVQTDECPGCHQSMTVGSNTGEKTIVAGREWHSECYRKAKYVKSPPLVSLSLTPCFQGIPALSVERHYKENPSAESVAIVCKLTINNPTP